VKALIVCHQSPQDSGTIKAVLEERGFDITTIMGYHDRLPGIDPLEHDLTVFMGGPMGVYQADWFPYLNNEIAYLRKRLAADKPVLGICLGAQLMAKALGKNVFKGPQGKEVGWMPIRVLDKNSPVRHFDESAGRIMQWHGDTFDLPDDATLLASSDLYKNQIYSHGKRAMALQCHVEVTEDILETWMAIDYAELEAFKLPVPQFREEVKKRVPLLEKQMRLFLNEWLDTVLA
jgi:GMP synthase (glutamine-hydrolysing)